MSKMTGLENIEDIPQKVLLLYNAVGQMTAENVDVNGLRVVNITDRAGIGKGTAYEYFDSKEDLLSCAMVYGVRKVAQILRDMLKPYKTFRERVEVFLNAIEESDRGTECIMAKYLHMITDPSELGRLTQEKLENENIKKDMPVAILAEIVKEGIDKGEVRSDLPKEYVVETLFAKFLTHMIFILRKPRDKAEIDKNRNLVYQSILNELCEKNR